MKTKHRTCPQAASIRADVCAHGFPVIVMLDQRGRDIAEAHIPPDRVEEVVASLRKAAADAKALRGTIQ